MINYIFEHRFERNVRYLFKFYTLIFEDSIHAYGRIKTNQSFNVKRESVKIHRGSIENITSHVISIIMNRKNASLVKEVIF